MARIRIIRSNPAISDAELAAALVAGTDLDEQEANALVRTVAHDAPTEVQGSSGNEHLLRRIAAVLQNNGFELAFDA
jgi:hypothetical protein